MCKSHTKKKRKSPHKEFIFLPDLVRSQGGECSANGSADRAEGAEFSRQRRGIKLRRNGSCLYLLSFTFCGLHSLSAPSVVCSCKNHDLVAALRVTSRRLIVLVLVQVKSSKKAELTIPPKASCSTLGALAKKQIDAPWVCRKKA